MYQSASHTLYEAGAPMSVDGEKEILSRLQHNTHGNILQREPWSWLRMIEMSTTIVVFDEESHILL